MVDTNIIRDRNSEVKSLPHLLFFAYEPIHLLPFAYVLSYNLHAIFQEAFNGTKKNLLVNDERIEVEIPKGIQTGSKIRIRNKGNIQIGKGKRGDLFIEVIVKMHPIWKVKAASEQK